MAVGAQAPEAMMGVQDVATIQDKVKTGLVSLRNVGRNCGTVLLPHAWGGAQAHDGMMLDWVGAVAIIVLSSILVALVASSGQALGAMLVTLMTLTVGYAGAAQTLVWLAARTVSVQQIGAFLVACDSALVVPGIVCIFVHARVMRAIVVAIGVGWAIWAGIPRLRDVVDPAKAIPAAVPPIVVLGAHAWFIVWC